MTKKIQGFSLAEFLLVLVLIGIVAAIAVPRFATAPNLDAQLQQLLSDLRYTQQLAMTHGQRFRLNFTLPATYNITNLSGTVVPNPATGSSNTTLSNATITLTNLPNNLIAFDEEGVPYANAAGNTALVANATIMLTANGLSRRIVITPQTGRMVAQ